MTNNVNAEHIENSIYYINETHCIKSSTEQPYPHPE